LALKIGSSPALSMVIRSEYRGKRYSMGSSGDLYACESRTNFDTIINRQQAPFSGAVAGEQVIKI
jgi:hypothetical protein